MEFNDTRDLKYRLDKDTDEIIKHTLVPAVDRWDSVADFTREAIRKEVKPLISIASGGRQARLLVRRLSDIRGVQEKEPKVNASAKMGNTELNKSRTASIPVADFGLLNDLTDETDLTRASAARYCIFKRLSVMADRTYLLEGWQERRIFQTWTELKISLAEPQHKLHNILTKRFHICDTMAYFIQQDPHHFEDFATVYKNEFYMSESYEQLQEQFGHKVFNDVENTIEKYAEVEFTAETDRDNPFFLDDEYESTGFLDNLE